VPWAVGLKPKLTKLSYAAGILNMQMLFRDAATVQLTSLKRFFLSLNLNEVTDKLLTAHSKVTN